MKLEDLEELEAWFDSEEAEEMIKNFVKEQEESERLEKASKLTYPNGHKVKMCDVFIDLEAKERCDLDPSKVHYGYYRYVYRINEDESVDLCLDANFALKSNNVHFDFNNAQLVERKVKLYNPLQELFK